VFAEDQSAKGFRATDGSKVQTVLRDAVPRLVKCRTLLRQGRDDGLVVNVTGFCSMPPVKANVSQLGAGLSMLVTMSSDD
jgi:hypothetical protein